MTLMCRMLVLSLCLMIVPLGAVQAADAPALQQADRVRLAEAFRLADWIGDRVWPGWSATPFAVLLITKDHEYLVRHPHPGSEWRAIGRDSLLASEVFTRPRVFPPDLQATFPVDDVPTVVIGQPRPDRAERSTAWVATLLHEHFHQWQNAAPDYFASVAALGLAGEDRTAMWMLNYPFPYGAAQADSDYARLSGAVTQALAGGQDGLAAVASAQDALARTVGAKDFSYLDFQLWQEGVARYTELRVADMAASGYQPGAAFMALPDYRPYADEAAAIRQRIMSELEHPDLARRKRLAVYALGAGQALMLDETDPAWRSRYLSDRFVMSKLVRDAADQTRQH